MAGILKEIANRSKQILDQSIEIRRYLHQHPELSYKETQTSAYIRSEIEKIGITDIRVVAGTGLLAHLKGEKEGNTRIILRAELDALPIDEKTEHSYKSINIGVMHACGHDSHMAMLLSSARILYELKSSFGGDIYFLFQPGEELAPGGASMVLSEGVLQEINPDAIIAQHVLPEMESGRIGLKPGKYMASSDEIYISVIGKGGHAALPGASTDQVTIAAALITSLKKEVSTIAGNQPAVLGIGRFIAEGATNVIPAEVNIEGTLRTFDESLRTRIHNRLGEVCKKAGQKDVKVKLEIRKGYPVLINNESLYDKAVEISRLVNGENSIDILDLRMSSEDFGFYSHEFPVLFYRLGVKDTGNEIRNLHTAHFDIHEPAMETGVRTLCSIAVGLLSQNPQTF